MTARRREAPQGRPEDDDGEMFRRLVDSPECPINDPDLLPDPRLGDGEVAPAAQQVVINVSRGATVNLTVVYGRPPAAGRRPRLE